MLYPVILCGGSGTRLWPASRKSYPKQFSPLLGPLSLYQRTLLRLSGPQYGAPMILTHHDFRFLTTDQAAAAGIIDADVLIEPARRNTAPAILTAAMRLEQEPDAMMLVAPCDHLIADEAAFEAAVTAGLEAARAGQIVTFGVPPERAETGYGYLELDTAPQGGAPAPLKSFVEKPDAKQAAAMFKSGNFLWNAGIFLFAVKDILRAFAAHAPELIGPCRAALDRGHADLGFYRLDETSYAKAQSISFDYAIMEKAQNRAVTPLQGSWSDLGAWDALWAALEPDENGVATAGSATALACENTLLRSEDPNIHLVGMGLKNITAVAMRDAVLVADMSASQQIGDVVKALQAAGIPQAITYPRCHRPWGWYETLCLGGRFQVKRIMVKPGGVLSLQSHIHRSEHWIVVAGTARVIVDETESLLSENQSVYIPLGARHRMENPGKVDMYIIEVQTGAYLGEDDITRYEDIYARDASE
jgi:mannose-1-phosphate guanylyltransferase/mannose-1-phosphate guanylyltransferase/mannose-6-phosphate isomerase